MELLDYTFGYWKVNKGSNQSQVVDNYFSPENSSKISNSSVKVAFLLHKMPGIKKYEDFVKYVQPYENLFATEEQKAALCTVQLMVVLIASSPALAILMLSNSRKANNFFITFFLYLN